MSIIIRKPQSPMLAQFIEYFWYMKSDAPSGDDTALVFPETRFEIILNYADPTVWQGIEQDVPLNGSYLSGLRKSFYRIKPQGSTEFLAIRFYPLAFYTLLKFPLSELSNQLWEVEDVLDPALQRLLQGALSIEELDDRLAYLEENLLDYLRGGLMHDHDLSGLLGHIDQRRGTDRIESLSEVTHYSRRSLERQFNQYLGINPKFYSRIVRFNSLFEQFSIQRPENVSSLARQYGFSDQAHLIREFKFFTGQTPGELMAELD